MEYIKATLQSGGTVYGLQTYFPYTDKMFFSNIDALLKDEEYFNNFVNAVGRINPFVFLFKKDFVFVIVFNVMVVNGIIARRYNVVLVKRVNIKVSNAHIVVNKR